ncbi:hypothetical protein H4R19_002582 [Coemansia spiralis]|nr:hypothetical protein H4R19_002582 [Coemansia spiralis]
MFAVRSWCSHPPPVTLAPAALGAAARARHFAKCTCTHSNNCALSTSCPAHPSAARATQAIRTESDIRREFGYPVKYHAGSFPWLLSAERQRVPMDDLDVHAGGASAGPAEQLLPLAARRRLAHTLNMHIARGALGAAAMDGVCDGAAAVLPRVAALLSGASDGSADAAAELERIFTPPLLARYTRDLGRLRADSVQLALEVHSVSGARIHQLRTQTGPAAAFAAQDAADAALPSSLRAGLARQGLHYTTLLGATHAAPRPAPVLPWSDAVLAAAGPRAPVRVRVDIELLVSMRYRLIGRHAAASKHDRLDGATTVIVDDDATRNLMLTLVSNVIHPDTDCDNGDNLEWRIADIDYLLSSEQRIASEFVQAKAASTTH